MSPRHPTLTLRFSAHYQWLSVSRLFRYSGAQPASLQPDADATLTAGPHGLVRHKGRAKDLAALQSQVVAKLGRQVCYPLTLYKDETRVIVGKLPTGLPGALSSSVLLLHSQSAPALIYIVTCSLVHVPRQLALWAMFHACISSP